MDNNYDLDLQSIQEARRLAEACYEAQQQFINFNQEQVDNICAAMADAAYNKSKQLGKMAADETGYGIALHKMLKNQLGSRTVWESIKDIKTVGIIREDHAKHVVEIGWPMGVVAALTPSTNPTSTTMYKILISVKSRNGIVLAPHPMAYRCSNETTGIMSEAGEAAGMPHGLVSCMSKVSLAGTQELIRHRRTSVILATGGSAMVGVAHSVGKPAYGVGPGNAPCYVDRSADVKKAAHNIVSSKAFDNSLICATEQSVVVDSPAASELRSEMERMGAYFVNPKQKIALANVLFSPKGVINRHSVGQTPQVLSQMANIQVPANASILVVPLSKVGKDEPLSREKLTTVLGWYEVDGWETGIEYCMKLVNFGGRGHTIIIHATDKNIIMNFGLKIPVFRILVNTMGSLGAVGGTTALAPSLTLGSGGIGHSITGDNITATHLLNIKRLAYEIKAPPELAVIDAESQRSSFNDDSNTDLDQVKAVVRAVVEEVLRRGIKH